MAKVLILFFALILLIFTRFWNLDHTARFIWDESSDLVSMHQIWEEKNITLVGPISEDGNKVFGSLTYYMLLPFAVIGGFGAVSTAIGAAFWGTLTSILLYLYLVRVLKRNAVMSFLISISWFPLLQSGRWAWNPNLIPFWVITALWLISFKKPIYIFLAGIALGLSFHHHYLSVFMITLYSAGYFWTAFQKHKTLNGVYFICGAVLSLSPFVLFDLAHPPGLFISRILYFNYLGTAENTFLSQVLNIYFQMINNFVPLKIGAFLVSVLVPVLFIKDIFSNSRNRIMYALVSAGFIIWLTTVEVVYNHYFLPIAIVFIVWLFIKRKGFSNFIANSIIVIVIASSLIVLPNTLTHLSWESDIKSLESITSTIENATTERELKNVNIVVLGSDDTNIYGRRYRDLLLIRKKIDVLSKDDIYKTDNLFVITTSSEDELRKDAAFELKNFRDGPIRGIWEIIGSDWKVYLFNRK